ncbi:MAG: hypothetical protein IKC29_05030 [Clostridia bacterium]|nr:hypothetical protein [Clostridia bacterium]
MPDLHDFHAYKSTGSGKGGGGGDGLGWLSKLIIVLAIVGILMLIGEA